MCTFELIPWERYKPHGPIAMNLIVPLLFFYKDVFGVKKPTKVDILWNKETKPNQTSTLEVTLKNRV